MSTTNIREKIKDIFVNLFAIKKEIVHDKLAREDVPGWDSLQHLNLILSLEETFNIEITPVEATEMLNFGLVLLLIEEKLKK